MNKEALAIFRQRRSIREFKAEQIKDEELNAVLEAGIFAPTGSGSQSPVIIAVQNKDDIARLSKMNAAIWGRDMDPYYGAPTILLVLADRSKPTPLEDGCSVLSNLTNAAYAAGLGSCWINREKEMFASEEGRSLLKRWGLTGDYIGVGAISLGYAAGPVPRPAPRKTDYIVLVK
ncbi:MAG: nitroreductase family protein [Desulfarculales bacterium]|nr:nitroreductase family protein [Desulfarculales bacterium]